MWPRLPRLFYGHAMILSVGAQGVSCSASFLRVGFYQSIVLFWVQSNHSMLGTILSMLEQEAVYPLNWIYAYNRSLGFVMYVCV